MISVRTEPQGLGNLLENPIKRKRNEKIFLSVFTKTQKGKEGFMKLTETHFLTFYL